jgi:hypothetical protein
MGVGTFQTDEMAGTERVLLWCSNVTCMAGHNVHVSKAALPAFNIAARNVNLPKKVNVTKRLT